MQKPRLSFWQIWNMSFGFMGIQFGWGLQLANMSGIYTYLGNYSTDWGAVRARRTSAWRRCSSARARMTCRCFGWLDQ